MSNLIALLCISILVFVQAAPSPCDALFKSHRKFAELVGQVIEYPDEFGALFKVSICKDSFSGCGKCTNGGAAGYCEVYEEKKRSEQNRTVEKRQDEGYQNCIGVYTSAEALINGIELLYDGGQFNSRGKVTISCNPDAGMFKNVRTTDITGKHMTFDSAMVCPGGGLSPGSVFCIILLVLVVVYVAGGVSYNKFKNQYEGMNLIPQYEFWQDVVSLIQLGFTFTLEKVRGLISRE